MHPAPADDCRLYLNSFRTGVRAQPASGDKESLGTGLNSELSVTAAEAEGRAERVKLCDSFSKRER